MTRLLKKRHLINAVLAAGAVGGLAVAVVAGVSVKSRTDSFSDFKTLYSSAWCFAHGLNAYSIPALQAVYTHQGMSQPAEWFGRYPVYPPTTLALIAPLTLLPITYSVCVFTMLSVLAFIGAVASMLDTCLDGQELSWGWKAIFVTLCASGPLLGFALIVGNLSVVATALGILAFMACRTRLLWIPASSLAMSILAKPHLGIWFTIAMLLLPEKERRSIALRAISVVGGFTALVVLVLAFTGNLAMQVGSFLSVLHAEAGIGASMNVSGREVLPIGGQITSLQSLLGFWTTSTFVIWVIALAALGLAGWWLISETLKAQTEVAAMLAAGAWLVFGLLSTYHRAHDAIALLILLPVLLHLFRQSAKDGRAWAISALYLTMSLGPSTEAVRREFVRLSEHSILSFVMLRQVSAAGVLLLIELLYVLRSERLRHAQTVGAKQTASEAGQRLARPSFAQPMVTDSPAKLTS